MAATADRTTKILTWAAHRALCRSLVVDRISFDSLVLEIGGGHSPFDHTPDLRARHRISTDPDFEELKRIRRGSSGGAYDIVAADGHSLPFPADSVSGIIAAFVLEHLADPGRFFAEAARVLRPGGFLFAVTPNLADPLFFPILLLPVRSRERVLQRLGGHPQHRYLTHLKANSLRRLRGLAGDAGFDLVRSDIAWEDHYFGRIPWGGRLLDFIDRRGTGTPLEDFAGRLYLLLEKRRSEPEAPT